VLPPFFLFLFLLLPFASFAQEHEPIPPDTLTVRQYAEFLQCTAATDPYGLYNEKMGDNPSSAYIVRNGAPGSYTYQAIPERAEDPVPYVSRLSAKRYCNWLQNGLPRGEQDETTTEEGAYTLDGTMEQDPAKEETANYFLPASTNNQIDPTLASNLKTYVIVTHFGDSFQCSSNTQNENQDAWTIAEVLGIIVGIAAIGSAILHSEEGPLYREGEYHDPRAAFTALYPRVAVLVPPSSPLPSYETAPVLSTVSHSASSSNDPATTLEQESLKMEPFSFPFEVRTSPLPNSPSPSQPSKRVTFHLPECLDSPNVQSLAKQALIPLSEKSSEIPPEKTTDLKAKREKFSKTIINFIDRQIKTFEWIDTSRKKFFQIIKVHFDFFNQQTTNLTDEDIAKIKAITPSLFQNPTSPCWKTQKERREFFECLDGMDEEITVGEKIIIDIESAKKIQKSVKDLISKKTVLFEVSEAIDIWQEEITMLQDRAKELHQNFSLPQFKTLAETTFDHLLDFQNYIDFRIASGAPIYEQTHSLTHDGLAALKDDQQTIEQWLPTNLEEKFSLLNKAINTLQLLLNHNLNEALRFLNFKEQQDQKRRNQAATESRDNSFSTERHTGLRTISLSSYRFRTYS